MSEETTPDPVPENGEKPSWWSRLPEGVQVTLAISAFFGGLGLLSTTLHYFNPRAQINTYSQSDLNSVFNKTAAVPLPDCVLTKQSTYTAANGKVYTITCP